MADPSPRALTVKQAAERALKGAPPGSEAHAERRMGMRGLSLRVEADGSFRRLPKKD
jgi:hypothetical protein